MPVNMMRAGPASSIQKSKGRRKDSGYQLVENPSSIANYKGDVFWRELESPPGAINTKSDLAYVSRSASTKDGTSKPFSTENYTTFTPSKEDRNRAVKKKLLEQQMLRNRRIVEQQRREESRKALVEEQQQKMKQQWQTKNKMKQEANHSRRKTIDQYEEDRKHAIMVKVMREDESRIRQLGESRNIERREKDDGYYNKVVRSLRNMEEIQLNNKPLPDGPDKVYTELWKRQEKLFMALDEKSLDTIKAMLAFTPTMLQAKPKKIYQDYGPHRHMQQLLNNLIANKITEQFFFKESAELVKRMSPAQIIEHYRRTEATKNGARRLMKVSSQTTIDRFIISWSAKKLDAGAARTVAARIVTDTLQHARSVYAHLMKGSSCDLALLGISAMDVPAAPKRPFSASSVSLGASGGEDHVHFSDRNMQFERPLEPGLHVHDLKPVGSRPRTPIPPHRLATAALPSASTQRLVDEITAHAERHLQRCGPEPPTSPTPSVVAARQQLRDGVMEKLEALQQRKGADWASGSAVKLLPRMGSAERDSFVDDMSQLVSSIIGSTLNQARAVMHNALGITHGRLASIPVRDGLDDVHHTDDIDDTDDDGAEVAAAAAAGAGSGASGDRTEVRQFRPMFGSKELGLNSRIMVSSLAAISVQHRHDKLGHDGHDHAPPVSHMKEFFRSRASVPIISTSTGRLPMAKRLSMPNTLPACMDPELMHTRHSFQSVVQPDLQTLPEYRDKTQRQVENVLQEHSWFGRIQELSPVISEEAVLNSVNLHEDEAPPTTAATDDSEVRVLVRSLPPTVHHLHAHLLPPRSAISMSAQRDIESSIHLRSPLHTQSVTASRLMLRCDSDPRLSLRTSVGEMNVDIHKHSDMCVDHDVYHEPESELRKLESSAMGFVAERTASASQVASVPLAADATAARRSGSADDGAVLQEAYAVDSDDETELRVRHILSKEATGAADQA